MNKRHLTLSEINYLLSLLENLPSPADEVSELNTFQYKIKLKTDLQKVKIDENKIDTFYYEIIKNYYYSIVKPGTPIGLLTSEAIGAPITQASFNSFHTVGRGNEDKSMGIDETKNLIAVSKTKLMKNVFIDAHFKNTDLTLEEVISMYSFFESINIYQLITEESLKYIPPYDEKEKENNSIEGREFWKNDYLAILPEEVSYKYQDLNFFFRIKLDIYKLWSYKITPFRLANHLRESGLNDDIIFPVPSPTSIGILDIYIDINSLRERSNFNLFSDEDKIQENKKACRLFYDEILKSHLKNTIIKGIPGIMKMTVKDRNTVLYFMNEEKFSFNLPKNEYLKEIEDNFKILYFKGSMMSNDGMPISKLVEVINFCGYEIMGCSEFFIYGKEENEKDFRQLEEIFREEMNGHLFYFIIKINDDQKDKKIINVIESNKDKCKGYKYYYASLYVDPLKESLLNVLPLDIIDTNRTISNSPHEIANVFGIDAAKRFLIKKFITGIGKSMNPRFIMNIVGFQTTKGQLLGINAIGSSRQKEGPFARASFQESTKCFAEGSAYGSREDTSGASVAIYLGKRINMGTGMCKIFNSKIKENTMKKSGRILSSKQDIISKYKYDNEYDVSNPIFVGFDANDLAGGTSLMEISLGMPSSRHPPNVIRSSIKLPQFAIGTYEMNTKQNFEFQTDYSIDAFLDFKDKI